MGSPQIGERIATGYRRQQEFFGRDVPFRPLFTRIRTKATKKPSKTEGRLDGPKKENP
jgi:hypothetical protein